MPLPPPSHDALVLSLRMHACALVERASLASLSAPACVDAVRCWTRTALCWLRWGGNGYALERAGDFFAGALRAQAAAGGWATLAWQLPAGAAEQHPRGELVKDLPVIPARLGHRSP